MASQENQESTTSESDHRARKGGGRLFAAYATVAVLALIALAVVLVLSFGSSPTRRGDPHINLASGSTNGVRPDNRPGIKHPLPERLNIQDAALKAGCELRLHLPDEGHQHIPPTAPEPDYGTNPPTSGKHIDEQQADGAYLETPRAVAVVHSLEHGRLAIQYHPDLDSEFQQELLGFYDTLYGGTLLFPNARMPYAVAATAWTKFLGCHKYRGPRTLDAIQAFGQATWGQYGGEPVTGLVPAAPTPAQPSSES